MLMLYTSWQNTVGRTKPILNAGIFKHNLRTPCKCSEKRNRCPALRHEPVLVMLSSRPTSPPRACLSSLQSHPIEAFPEFVARTRFPSHSVTRLVLLVVTILKSREIQLLSLRAKVFLVTYQLQWPPTHMVCHVQHRTALCRRSLQPSEGLTNVAALDGIFLFFRQIEETWFAFPFLCVIGASLRFFLVCSKSLLVKVFRLLDFESLFGQGLHDFVSQKTYDTLIISTKKKAKE